MSMQQVIAGKIESALNPQLLQVENESHMHGGPATESHFKITAVSPAFNEQSLVQRHRNIYALLSAELAGSVHALALHLYTPEEWQARQEQIPASPDCKGGSKTES